MQRAASRGDSEIRNTPLGRRAWERWKVIAQKIGDFQARWILGLLYLGLVGPVALLRRLAADPLGLRREWRGSYWISRPAADLTIDVAQRQ